MRSEDIIFAFTTFIHFFWIFPLVSKEFDALNTEYYPFLIESCDMRVSDFLDSSWRVLMLNNFGFFTRWQGKLVSGTLRRTRHKQFLVRDREEC